MTTTVVVGNPKPASRTLGAATSVARAITGTEPDRIVDLVTFGAGLLERADPDVDAAVQQVLASDLLVVASPTYKATFTGVLKLFLERFGAGSLSGVVTVPMMLGGSWRHALSVEVHLKPVLAELGASVPTAGLYLLDSDVDGQDLADWLAVARQQLPSHVLG